MNDEVKVCVDSKIDYFEQYFAIPAEVQNSVEEFASETRALGESCVKATEFEEKFASSGLSAKFGTLLSKCIPKARKMSREEKKESLKIAKNIISENKKDFADYAIDSALQSARVAVTEELTTQSRERMIADGTYADHTIITNTVEDAGNVLDFFIGKLGKKKDGGKK